MIDPTNVCIRLVDGEEILGDILSDMGFLVVQTEAWRYEIPWSAVIFVRYVGGGEPAP